MKQPRRALEWPIQIDRYSQQPLDAQLTEQLRAAILSGQLRPGTPLPSTRHLATTLGLSRTTTYTAYGRLLSEGYLVSKQGYGTRVSDELPTAPRLQRIQPLARPYWLHRLPLLSPGDEPIPDDVIAFRTGVTCMPEQSQALWRRSWKQSARRALPTDYDSPAGDPELREALAAYLGRARGLLCTSDDIVITSGSTHALDLIVRATLLPGDTFGMEEPGYPIVQQLLQLHGLHILPIPVDDNGIQVTDLPGGNQAPRAVYITPSHQYPLGSRLPLSRRMTLLKWAQENGVLLIEDDYDSEFRFNAPPLPTLASMDTTLQHVAYLGTFSKVLTPALRCGYMVVPPILREQVMRQRVRSDFHPSWPLQQALTIFLNEGYLEQHIRHMRAHYAQSRMTLTRIFSQATPFASLRGQEAGLHVFLETWTDAQQIVEHARKQNVQVNSLRDYCLTASERQGLVLGYGGLTNQQIVRGTQRLVSIIQQARQAQTLKKAL